MLGDYWRVHVDFHDQWLVAVAQVPQYSLPRVPLATLDYPLHLLKWVMSAKHSGGLIVRPDHVFLRIEVRVFVRVVFFSGLAALVGSGVEAMVGPCLDDEACLLSSRNTTLSLSMLTSSLRLSMPLVSMTKYLSWRSRTRNADLRIEAVETKRFKPVNVTVCFKSCFQLSMEAFDLAIRSGVAGCCGDTIAFQRAH